MVESKDEERLLLLQDIDARRINRNRVQVEAYQSDSSENDDDQSDDEIVAGTGRKTDVDEKSLTGELNNGNGNDDDDDDDDMFASDDDQEVKNGTTSNTKKIKGPKVLDMDQFEKELYDEDEVELPQIDQEEDMIEGDIDEIQDEESRKIDKETLQKYYEHQEDFQEIDALERARIKKLTGPKIEAFNLKKESKKGTFDENGNYVRKKAKFDEDEDEDNDNESESESDDESEEKKLNTKDSWLSSVTKLDIQKAKEAEESRKEKQRNELKIKRATLISIPTEDIIKRLVRQLQPVETSMELLQRLNGQAKQLKKLKQREKERELRSKIQDIMNDIEMLVERRYAAYDLEREELLRIYSKLTGGKSLELNGGTEKESRKRSREEEEEEEEEVGGDNDSTEISKYDIQWEYKWVNSEDDQDTTDIYGPFDSYTMNEWKKTYFIENPAVVRRVGETGDFIDVFKVNFE
ncbi:hypothetical protein CANARDRAFT_175958 [[Candida] arabinofermentans NRRL YB-2248]|uniref:GYF domain-containing protein n=1 Tax=[Candida] arabinofermentans NRRL YB-2248 TaxID=983967 RepID=A0A1E4T1C0_9ASCO|nr:hypothetical protein CANARDRAFT_175958 [[Candida] arabinofermentans NRRL YB-2248]